MAVSPTPADAPRRGDGITSSARAGGVFAKRKSCSLPSSKGRLVCLYHRSSKPAVQPFDELLGQVLILGVGAVPKDAGHFVAGFPPEFADAIPERLPRQCRVKAALHL